MGEHLHDQGWTVVGLRIPGHGTCPKALAEVSYEDWIAAVRVAARGLRAMIPENAPMILVGFSNGGALSVDYASAAVDDPSLPAPAGVMLFSPMIGITPMARLSQVYRVVELIPGFEKAAWQGIGAEIDPYKYSSWPMNASEQAWRLTARVEARLARLQRQGKMDQMAPVLAFQSAVDSTVEVPMLIRRLFDRTTGGRSELVLFDVNRVTVLDDLLKLGFENQIVPLLDRKDLPFVLTLVTNKSGESLDVVARRRAGESFVETDLEMAWPPHVFSLSHVAMPIPADDPVYGTEEATRATGLPLGSLDLRGETGVLRISEKLMFRQRNNPFYAYAQHRADAWVGAIVGSK
jgi:alpha-beta hydrolase superfamily lysophospholipase